MSVAVRLERDGQEQCSQRDVVLAQSPPLEKGEILRVARSPGIRPDLFPAI